MWGKLINGVLKHAKSYLVYNGRKYWNAPEELWREAGWKTVIYGEYPEGYDAVIIEYTEDELNIYVHYVGVEPDGIE